MKNIYLIHLVLVYNNHLIYLYEYIIICNNFLEIMTKMNKNIPIAASCFDFDEYTSIIKELNNS